MFKKKKFASILLISCLVFSIFGFQASAAEEFDIVAAKQQLVQKAEQKLQTHSLNVTSEEEINKRLAKLTSDGVDPTVIADEMENYGVFHLETPELSMRTAGIDNSSITMNAPNIYYDSNTKQWIIVAGGYWKDDKWLDHVPTVQSFPMNVGGKNGFGVGFTATGGKYETKVDSHYAYMSDGKGNEISTTSRSDGDGRQGFGFQLQDYLNKTCYCPVYWPPTTEKFSYIGKHFAGLARYDSKFDSYRGVATTYYIHTYDEAYISSIKFNVSGKTAGVEFNIANASKSFSAYSNDSRF
ncbi:hypothetical protein [Paenibacillus alvei]|uniref:Uncharacterized protein n=1 Tax=Paenibacillus alvei TaxID=44250 RepID=A0A383R5U4_PAEAL|nr:hypothetical protein [Paenibacillus alvei]SYX82455.1 conserved exported protein of unknown function [Paenibacillus alvei]